MVIARALPSSESEEVLLIRHATTDMTGTLCGQIDPPLNAMGREQASALASLLRNWNVRRLYASDLQRALQTAQPLAELWNIPIVARSDLREISFGAWEGRRWSEIRAEGPDITAMETSPELGAPGGETFACFRNRVLSTLKETTADSGGQLTAIVTHLGVMRVVLNELSKPQLNQANRVWNPLQRIDPCAIYRILVNGGSFELVGELKTE
jgi:broad specificity phosphatase PhoE